MENEVSGKIFLTSGNIRKRGLTLLSVAKKKADMVGPASGQTRKTDKKTTYFLKRSAGRGGNFFFPAETAGGEKDRVVAQ